jgi:uncharacterized protein YjiK
LGATDLLVNVLKACSPDRLFSWNGDCIILFMILRNCFPIVLSAVLTFGPQVPENTDKESYDLSHPTRTWELPQELKEISGICWRDAGHLVAIEDLTPTLYLLNLSQKPVIERKIEFREHQGEKFDTEDVALVGNTAYSLWSHGSLFEVAEWQGSPHVREYDTELSKKNNTEGLCYDPVSGYLLIACKNKAGLSGEKQSTRSIYAFDRSKGQLLPEPFLLIRHKELKNIIGSKVGFYPSAIAVHPKTGNIYLLSTHETKGLACFNRQGKLLSFSAIDASLMPQPEGLSFAPDGTLYISSQGRHGKPAQVLEFRQQ